MFTLEALCEVCPSLPGTMAGAYLPGLNDACAEFQVNTPQRQAAFIAQIAHESNQLRETVERASGNAYDPTVNAKIAARLGNTEAGDGPRYKGRGFIQLTGRWNYGAAGKALGLDLVNEPDQAADPATAFRVAGWYWKTHGCNQLADLGDFDAITKRINGAFLGLASREVFWTRAKRALGVTPPVPHS